MYHDWSMYSCGYLTQIPGASRGHSSQHLHSLAVCTGVAQMTHPWLFPVKKALKKKKKLLVYKLP